MTFFLAVGTLCGICAVLAFLLMIADRYLNNYGVCRVSINGGERVLEVDGGSSILTALSAEKIFIPSACGGRGSCGLCKLRATRGGGPILPTEEPHLTAAEIKDEVRLSCQVKLREDIDIEIPEELFLIREYKACAAEIIDCTHDIKRLRMELIEPETISFSPGVYVQLQAPPYAKSSESVYRAYSVASDPRDTRHVDLLIRRVPNGICTTWVFDYLAEGDEVTFNGPYGDFRLQESAAEAIFIAGGSGMAPFCSILADMEHRGDARRTRCFFGAVSRRDMFYIDEMAHYEEELPDFRFIPALSGPTEEDSWQGETGLITEVVGRHYKDCSKMEAYLCGSPGMIDACIRVLSEKGMPEDQIFYDKFA